MIARRALVVAARPPEIDRDGGSRRLFDLVESLRSDGWHVAFASEEVVEGPYVRTLQRLGVETHCGVGTSVEDLLAGDSLPDLTLVESWDVGQRHLPTLCRLSPETRIVVESGGLEVARAQEAAQELAIYAFADLVLTASENEAELLGHLLGERSLARPVPDGVEAPGSAKPLEERRGIVFVGNFHNEATFDAALFLVRDVVPRLAPELLDAHPVRLVGNGAERLWLLYSAENLPAGVEIVGWVPSVQPYLAEARVSAVPLRHAAGARRKLIEALAAGTPAVSTTVGVGDLSGLAGGTDVVAADDPAAFATALERLLVDDALWRRRSAAGQRDVLASHSRDVVRVSFRRAVEGVLGAGRVGRRPEDDLEPDAAPRSEEARERIAEIVEHVVRPEATFLVMSRGDEELLRLAGRTGWHFPSSDDGKDAGGAPCDSAAAIARLEELRAKGAEYVVFPASASRWLDRHRKFALYLEARYRRGWADDACVIYDLGRPGGRLSGAAGPTQGAIQEHLRPQISAAARRRSVDEVSPARSVLVVGVYLADRPNYVDDIVAVVGAEGRFRVTQRWTALGGPPPTPRVAEVTRRVVLEPRPKYGLLNDLLGDDYGRYDFVVTLDDDILLPRRFLDTFLSLQVRLGFALAQPARTTESYVDHPIVAQRSGLLARETRFVEVGPAVSFERSSHDLLLPFDLASPMGWGYENVWARAIADAGLKMGIIDAVPVDHSLRQPLDRYSWRHANQQRIEFLGSCKHLPDDECARVLDVVEVEA